jgi:P4 family phage/plasmid primase-like protien
VGLMEKNKPIFNKDQLHVYFEKNQIYDDQGNTFSFSTDVLFDENLNFWKQNCIRYEMSDDTDVINNFKNYFSSNSGFLNSGSKNRILEAYRQYGRDKYKKIKQIPEDCVVFSNHIVYVGQKNATEIFTEQTTIADDIYINNGYITSNFNYFITNPIKYEHKPTQEHTCPTIDNLFEDWVGTKNKEMLYEIIAYCMIPKYPIHRIFYLFGSGRNGKSTFLKILKRIIGEDNVAASNLTTLTETPFGTSQLYKKLVCYIAETDSHKLEKTSILKSLSGQDVITAQYKGKPLFTFENYAKVIISTNTIPQTSDKTIGNYSRYIIIDFKNRYDETKDVFESIPEAEFEALANVCISKLKNLLKKRKFTNEPSLEDKIKFYEEKSNPLKAFIEQTFEITENVEDYIFAYNFYDLYTNWLDKNGYSKNITRKAVGYEVHQLDIESSRAVNYDFPDKPQHVTYVGLKLKQKVTLEKEVEIIDSKEYTKEEIVEYFKSENKLAINYDTSEAIRLLKKNNTIYEPKDGVYKINNRNI